MEKSHGKHHETLPPVETWIPIPLQLAQYWMLVLRDKSTKASDETDTCCFFSCFFFLLKHPIHNHFDNPLVSATTTLPQ
jgi:hypothetical protein